jgi:trans-aconitate 2-methyltransferase
MWDPEQYLKFESERARPFFELVNAIDHPRPLRVADLGCGPGGLSASLLPHWPEASIWGIDSSEEMIACARQRAVSDRLRFQCADVATWRAPAPLDVILSNACFHWIPDHGRLLDHLLGQLAPGGVLAFQVPNNFGEPSHLVVEELIREPEWHANFSGVRPGAVENPDWYLEQLTARGLETVVWETTYYHLLGGPHPVLEWLKGTTLRPLLAVLDEDQRRLFLGACAERLDRAYPRRASGTIFPFRRLFVIARRPA